MRQAANGDLLKADSSIPYTVRRAKASARCLKTGHQMPYLGPKFDLRKGKRARNVTKSLFRPVKGNLFVPLGYAMIFLMEIFPHLFARLRQFALGVSIFNRVWIGNSVIIIFGAVAGTMITRQLTLFGNVWLILLFSTAGVLITLLVNRLIIRSALHPIHELGNAIEHVNTGKIDIPDSLKYYRDPDIQRLVAALDSMLKRLANRTSQLQAISERAINAQEEERVRIARSLHDDTAQSISMLIIHLERLKNAIPADIPDLTRRVAEAENVATRLLENLRKVIWDLRPSILDDLGLLAAIRWFARTNLEAVGVAVEFLDGNEVVRLPSHLETMLFRICQEAVSNIIRHADAHKVSIHLWPQEASIWLEIKDDGRGFDIEQAVGGAVYRKQLGLLGIQERVSLVGGEMEVESAAGSGTCLRVRVPLPAEDLTGSSGVTSHPFELPEEMIQP
jgi:two-component system sensor histidine kinase UhpB